MFITSRLRCLGHVQRREGTLLNKIYGGRIGGRRGRIRPRKAGLEIVVEDLREMGIGVEEERVTE